MKTLQTELEIFARTLHRRIGFYMDELSPHVGKGPSIDEAYISGKYIELREISDMLDDLLVSMEMFK